MPSPVDRALAPPMDPGYRDLLEALVAVADPDDRIRAVWLGGSIARGVSDAGSDLDVILAVRDEARADFEAGWREWLDSIAPILLAEQVPGVPGIFAATTVDCLRLDIVIESLGELAETPYRTRLAVIDRDGLTDRIPVPEPEPGPDRDRIRVVIHEFYRQQAIFPAAVVAREDWLLGVVAVHEMQRLLFQVLGACNAPLPPDGREAVEQPTHRRAAARPHRAAAANRHASPSHRGDAGCAQGVSRVRATADRVGRRRLAGRRRCGRHRVLAPGQPGRLSQLRATPAALACCP